MAKAFLTERENAVRVRGEIFTQLYVLKEGADPAETLKKIRFRSSVLPKIMGWAVFGFVVLGCAIEFLWGFTALNFCLLLVALFAFLLPLACRSEKSSDLGVRGPFYMEGRVSDYGGLTDLQAEALVKAKTSEVLEEVKRLIWEELSQERREYKEAREAKVKAKAEALLQGEKGSEKFPKKEAANLPTKGIKLEEFLS